MADLGTREPSPIRFVIAGVGAVALTVGVGALAASPTPKVQVLGIAVPLLLLGAVVAVANPRAVYGSLAFILGAAPLAIVPGIALPAFLLLTLATWVTVLIHRLEQTRVRAIEVTVVGFVAVSAISAVVTTQGSAYISEFIKWAIATSLVFALLRLDRTTLRFFGRTYVYGAAVGATFALGMFAFDKAGTIINRLSIIGYGQTGTIGTHLRFYKTDDVSVVRLTGTYVDPNAAGIFLFVGLVLAVALLRGWSRVLLGGIIMIALVVTLSRSAIFSVVVALIVFFLFQRMRGGLRLGILAVGIGAVATALAVPSINRRIFDSFGSQDKGSRDRADALDNFIPSMSGHWWWGRGWGAPEFTDEVIGYKTNYVANTPLLTTYRGGILVGIAFIVVLLVTIVVASRSMRENRWERGVLVAGFIGFSVVALQLDFPVVTQAPMTLVFSVFIAMVAANPVERFAGAGKHRAQTDDEPTPRALGRSTPPTRIRSGIPRSVSTNSPALREVASHV
ncbi:O-antigen ligase family protein [Williamsia sp. CHRR-6]|uniref:O-antigen ligase family protein n=1 Tax=Williamsia sp. CHRR-6 TaxID=2835871 RepID=UPI001BD9554B|nr:O-antigen ligase family protein [Williamsia sp. CHRR-6]MBT0565933.1 O-antigen ligase family protein [Williamsia sp. CHRR-6]